MRRLRSPAWLLALTILAVVSGVVALLLALRQEPAVSLQVEEVAAARGADGSIRLQVSGDELYDGLGAVLIPSLGGDPMPATQLGVPVAIYQLATDGRLAVATTRDHRLLAMDVTAGRRPVVTGAIKLSPEPVSVGATPVAAVELIGSMAVIARSDRGLTLIDVTDPAMPRQVDHLDFRSNFSEMESSGELLYATNSTTGILVVKLDGGHLQQRFVVASPKAWRLAVHGRRLVVGTHKGELTLFDLEEDGRPRLAGTLELGQDLRDLALAAESLYACTARGELLEFSLGSWPSPTLAAQLDLQGRPLRIEWVEESRRLYCSLVSQGTAIIDAGQPGAPRFLSLLAMAKAPLTQVVSGGRLFLGGSNGLQVVSADAPQLSLAPSRAIQPFTEVAGKVRLLPWGDSVFAYDQQGLLKLVGRLRPVAAHGGGATPKAPLLPLPGSDKLRLHAVRDGMLQGEVLGRVPVADPDVITPLNEVDLIRGAFWKSGRLYVLTPFGLSIFDCDPSGAVVPAGEHRLPGDAVAMAWLDPAMVVVAMRQKGLRVVDVSKPAVPVTVSEYPIPRHLRTIGPFGDALLDGRRLYVSRGRLGVALFDLSEPAAPRLIQQIDTPGHAYRLSLEDGLLTVSDQDAGVFVIDVRGEYGIPVGSYPLPLVPRDLLTYGRRCFVVNSAGGVLDLPAPRRLAKGGSAAENQLLFTAPADIPAGRYTLFLYAGGDVASFPVVLQ